MLINETNQCRDMIAQLSCSSIRLNSYADYESVFLNREPPGEDDPEDDNH